MSHPLVFISRNHIKDGRAEDYKAFYREQVLLLEQEKPGTVAHLAFMNEEGTELTIVHIFLDARAMEQHMVGIGEKARASYEMIESRGLELYGTPRAGTLEMMQQIAGMGVPVTIWPDAVGGYVRLQAG